MMQRRPGTPQLAVLWDLESLKPFTEQHMSPPQAGDPDEQQQQRSARAGPSGGGRGSRLAAAGLLGGASSPDLVRALDQLCRTIQHYGTVHSVHLFLRESTLVKAPVLRRQVQQLRTWASPREEVSLEPEQGPSEASEALEAAAQGATHAGAAPRAEPQPSGPGGNSAGTGGRRRASVRLPPSEDVHDCPMCRSSHSSRLALLRHFAAVHQGPLMGATATDARTHIMWTRGRAVTLPAAAPADPWVSSAADVDATPPAESTAEKVMVSPEEFVYAREMLMRGRHLDELLASAPVAVHTAGATGAAAAAAEASAAGRGVISEGGGESGASLSRRGLHLHMVPPGQPAEAAAAALRQVAEALALNQAASSTSLAPPERGGGRAGGRQSAGRAVQRGRGRKGGRGGWAEAEEAPAAAVPCFCLVSDAEGLDQTLADLRQHDVMAMAVTRVTRVPSADVSLRWWAVQAGEYRLVAGRSR